MDPTVFEEGAGQNLADFYAEKLNTIKNFFKTLSVDEIMNWSPKLLEKPLLKASRLIKNESLQIFKHLQCYMCDRTSSKKSVNHVMKHLTLCLKVSGTIFDEAYIQVLKQINNNPDRLVNIYVKRFKNA